MICLLMSIKKREEFQTLERDISREVGQFSSIGSIMLRMCHEYQVVLRLLMVRGKPEFSADRFTSVDEY